MIYIGCSKRPFRLYEEQDILDIISYLGGVEWLLKAVLSDTKDHVVQPIRRGILKAVTSIRTSQLAGPLK